LEQTSRPSESHDKTKTTIFGLQMIQSFRDLTHVLV
jgi:hypothetical protein